MGGHFSDSSEDVSDPRCGLDALLRKYLRVWIWSIIFGLDTTLTLTLSTQSFAKYSFGCRCHRGGITA